MDKREFLQKLEEVLLEKMDISDVAEHIRYYSDYINNEVDKGRSEEEVIKSLQSPRLIAKSITSNTDRANKYDSNISNRSKKYDYSYDNYYNNSHNSDSNKTYSSGPNFSINGKPINGTVVKIVMFIIGILIVGLIIAALGLMAWALLNIVLPIMLVVFIINIIRNIFSGKR